MPLLKARNIPVEIYNTITQIARNKGASVSARRERRRAVFMDIDKLKISGADNFPSPEELVREDRDK